MNTSPPTSPPYFQCRLCGSREYERVVVKKRDGTPYGTSFYACMGCTTMFVNAEKFSAPPPPVKITRIDAPVSLRRSRGISRLEGPAAPLAVKEAKTATR